MRFMQRRNVDLPQPDGPISAVIDCLWMSRVTPLTASAAPYHTERSSMSNTTSRVIGALSAESDVATEAREGTARASERGGSTTLTGGVSAPLLSCGVHMM